MIRIADVLTVVAGLARLTGCSGGGGGGGSTFHPTPGPPPAPEASREFRAIAGVSMGAYGAMNLGTKHTDLFSTVAALGGPVDMRQMLHDSISDNLEVKPQTTIPHRIGDDFTYDHQAPYPGRDVRLTMFQDLSIAFGNPFLHHPDPSRQYLASDSEPAQIGQDDQFGAFTAPAEPRGFMDGGDANHDGVRETGEQPKLFSDVGLLAVGSLPMIVSGAAPVSVGGRMIADLNGDGVFDVGEGLVLNPSEPFTDANDNGIFEPELGETYEDVGLDGVAGTGDFGEGNGTFDYDPDRDHWLAEDPYTRLAARSADEIATQRVYMDVGTEDEFGFARHYDNLVALLRDKGLAVDEMEGFPANCADLTEPNAQFELVRYMAGHIGVKEVDPDDLLHGNVCGEDTVWQRVISMIAFLNQSFPDGFFGPGGNFTPGINIDFDHLDVDLPNLNVRGEVIQRRISSPALAVEGGQVPQRDVLVYRPPAFHRTGKTFPLVYFLGGYGQEPSDFRRVSLLLDALILTNQLQNMAFAFVPGAGGRQGSFYVNHVVPESQVPDLTPVTSGRYEDSLIDDIMPVVELDILKGRVKQ
ncbi:MAG TPA: alpha/beta hydrolase-fold protein [Candidatus Dormibacteraeota bacterium]|nr:alpha/beta hydrolase-fold protein [Candidatus Dormibacteraeota bacterium]